MPDFVSSGDGENSNGRAGIENIAKIACICPLKKFEDISKFRE
jgi:hypothetical protein